MALLKRSPLKPGTKSLKRSPMARGTSSLKQRKPLQAKLPMKRASKPIASVGARAKRMGQGKVPPTAAERDWMNKVAAFGCIVCWKFYGIKLPCAVHHILSGGRRMGHLFTIGLCDPGHHQGGDKEGRFISRHPWKARFQEAYGTELELLEELRGMLATQK